MKNRSRELPAKVQTKHIVMLILSCVFLLISLSGERDLLEIFLLPDAPFADGPATPSDDGTGMGWFGVFLGEAVKGFALFVLLAALIPCWGLGTVITVLLAMNRHDKPKWLWMVSLGMAVVFVLIGAVLITSWILV